MIEDKTLSLWLKIFIFILISKINCFDQQNNIVNLKTNSIRSRQVIESITNSSSITSHSTRNDGTINVPVIYLNTTELIKRQGYLFEEYKVITEDGYILLLTRIVTGNLTSYNPVLIIHGFLGTSEQFLLMGHDHGLAPILADNGFDVWLGDQRGNVYSSSHVNYKRNNPKFWDFSIHENGIYDIPAFINKIQKVTKAPQISLIGYSMGGSTFLIAGAEKPRYIAKNVKLSVLLGPFYCPPRAHRSPLLDIVAFNADKVVKSHVKRRLYEFLPRVQTMQRITEILCRPDVAVDFCLTFVGMVAGDNRKNVNRDMVSLYYSLGLAGTSLKTYQHIAQIYKSGKFRQFDYGINENIYKYGQITPPRYKIENILTPIIIANGKSDVVLDKQTVEKLTRILPNVVLAHEANDPKFNHIDFIHGLSAKDQVFDKILDLMKNMTTLNLKLTLTELIKRRGYQAEEYKVITDDGYKLQLTRIVTCNLGPYLPVLFIHGVFATSEQFLMLGHNHGLELNLLNSGSFLFCANCHGPHSARSKNCPIYKQEVAVQENKTTQKVSYFDSRKIVLGRMAKIGSHAQVAPTTSLKSQDALSELTPALAKMVEHIVKGKLKSQRSREKSPKLLLKKAEISMEKSFAKPKCEPTISAYVKPKEAVTQRKNEPTTFKLKVQEEKITIEGSAKPEVMILEKEDFKTPTMKPPKARRPLAEQASILADNGFDVWLGDQRGDVYSRSHVKYQPNNPKFWNFSFQEDGIYDIPAFVNKIKEITKAPQVSFIGHSMGGTVFLVTGAERPDYAAKNIRLSVLLGPFYPPKIYKTGFLDIFMRNADFIVKTHTRAKQFEFLPRSRLMQRLSEIFCKPNLVPGVCLTMIGMIAGDNRNNVDINMAHLYSSSMVAGTSLKTYEHLAQVYKSGKFQKYDYGAKGNIEKYGQSTPPLYKLENIQTPIIIAYGKNDGFLDKPTVEILTRVLPNVIKAHEAKDPKFTHTDFVFGNSAKILVYDQILDIMKNMTRIDQ
ncbi:uncharacterized protein LOC142329474 [Lycorma delicatula]|uniref:uncharacterized protein LOC142329474 n=1 Tax=Lycorma delicatula TaxID=130591 RepID=UPI003F511D3F